MSFSNSIDKIYRYSLLLIAFFIPLHTRFTGSLIVVATVTCLIHNHLRISIPKRNVTILMFFILLYTCYAIGLIYTDLSEVGWQKMQLRLSMIAFPLIFLSGSAQETINRKTIMNWFIAGGVIVSIYLLGHAVYIYLAEHRNIFFGQSITYKTGFSVTYLSMYFVLMIGALFTNLQTEKLTIFDKGIKCGIVLLFLIMLLSFSSRTQIISLVIVIIAFIFFMAMELKEKRIRKITLYLTLLVVLVSVILSYPSTGQRLVNMVKQWNEPYTDQHPTSENMRQIAWKISLDQILRHPLLGVGTGDADTSLFKSYSDQKLKWPFTDRLNSHNQFLQTSLAIGIAGLAALLLLLTASLTKAIKNHDRLYIAFLLVIILACCSESILETEAGVVFFAFFNSLFANGDTKEYLR